MTLPDWLAVCVLFFGWMATFVAGYVLGRIHHVNKLKRDCEREWQKGLIPLTEAEAERYRRESLRQAIKWLQ